MIGHFGFSYIGLIFLMLLFIPNIIWIRKKPQGYISENENKVLLFFERSGEVLTTVIALVFDDFNLHRWSNWTWWLIAAFVLMLLYNYGGYAIFRANKNFQTFIAAS